MLEKILVEICEKFPFEYQEKDKKGAYTLILETMRVKILPLDPGFSLYAPFGDVPGDGTLKDPDAFYTYLTQANYLGQGTGRNIITINETGKQFLLKRKVKREPSFGQFKDDLEQFANYLEYWQEKVKEIGFA